MIEIKLNLEQYEKWHLNHIESSSPLKVTLLHLLTDLIFDFFHQCYTVFIIQVVLDFWCCYKWYFWIPSWSLLTTYKYCLFLYIDFVSETSIKSLNSFYSFWKIDFWVKKIYTILFSINRDTSPLYHLDSLVWWWIGKQRSLSCSEIREKAFTFSLIIGC